MQIKIAQHLSGMGARRRRPAHGQSISAMRDLDRKLPLDLGEMLVVWPDHAREHCVIAELERHDVAGIVILLAAGVQSATAASVSSPPMLFVLSSVIRTRASR